MPIGPLPGWIKSYEPKTKEHYDAVQAEESSDAAEIWSGWVDDNTKGIQVAPPYSASMGSTNPKNFSPLILEGLATPIDAAQRIATAWQNYYLGITFSVVPPIPPFLTITSIVPSPLGVSSAYLTLFTGLAAEMVVVPPDPVTAFLLKATAFATLFNTATLAAGVQISGTAPGTPPVPLVLPLIPVL